MWGRMQDWLQLGTRFTEMPCLHRSDCQQSTRRSRCISTTPLRLRLKRCGQRFVCRWYHVQRTGMSDATKSVAMAQLKIRSRVGRLSRRRNCWPITVHVVVEMHPIAT